MECMEIILDRIIWKGIYFMKCDKSSNSNDFLIIFNLREVLD